MFIVLATAFLLVCNQLQAQTATPKPPKVSDIFLEFVSKELELTPTETAGIQPLVKQYLSERGKTARTFKDPLEREQRILSLKMKYRREMTKVIGSQKATRFFTSEQSFRRKVKEVLRERQQQKKNN